MKKKHTTRVQQQKILEEPEQYTWIVQINNISKLKRKFPKDYCIELLQEEDRSQLSELYYASYSHEIVLNLAEAQREMDLVFQNEYGRLNFSASFNIMYKNKIVASIITVVLAPWDDTPSGPFIIELMVNPNHRRLGIAYYLIQFTADKLAESGSKTVALRVMSDNVKARNLYRKCGFVSWDGTSEVI